MVEERGEPLLLPLPCELAVRAPAPVTRFPGPAPGACFAGPRSPWPPPFAPPAPPPVARLCSSASSLLWRSLTSHAPCIIGFGSSPSRCGPARHAALVRHRDLPVPVQRSVGTCQGLRPRRADQVLAMTHPIMLPSATPNSVGTRNNLDFRGSMAGLCPPLPTLHRHPRGRRRTARGRCGSLLLHRSGLAPSTPCRSPGALRVKSGHKVARLGRATAFGDFSDYPPARTTAILLRIQRMLSWWTWRQPSCRRSRRSPMSENSGPGLAVNASSAHWGHSSACTCGHCRTGTARYGQSSVLLGAEVQAVKHSRAIADAARSSGKSC